MRKMINVCLLFVLLICTGFQTSGRELAHKKNQKGLKLEYKVTVDQNNKKEFSIKARISGIQTESIHLRMTANYGRVEKLNDLIPYITISSNREGISGIEKINEFSWKISLNSSEVEVDYSVNTQFPYSSLNMVRLPFRDENHLYFPASSVFIYPDEQYLNENNIKIHKISIHFELPSGWVAATSWGIDKLTYELDPPALDTLMAGLSIQKNKGRALYFGIISYGPPSGPLSVDRIDKESPAYAAGLREGDIILEINGRKIKTSAAIKELARNIPENEQVELTLERNGKRLHTTTSWNSYATEFAIIKKE